MTCRFAQTRSRQLFFIKRYQPRALHGMFRHILGHLSERRTDRHRRVDTWKRELRAVGRFPIDAQFFPNPNQRSIVQPVRFEMKSVLEPRRRRPRKEVSSLESFSRVWHSISHKPGNNTNTLAADGFHAGPTVKASLNSFGSLTPSPFTEFFIPLCL